VSWEPEGREEEIGWNERKDSLKRLLASQRQRAAEEGFPAGQVALGNSVYDLKQPLTSRAQPTRLDQHEALSYDLGRFVCEAPIDFLEGDRASDAQ
jgi:hypothetical protein